MELTVIKAGKELEFFTEGGLDPFLAEVKTMVEGFEHDMTTKKGRDATRSFAYKIATFKGLVEDSGKALVSDWKTKAKRVDESRKHSRDTLDALKAEARKPLTEWEEAEVKRVEAYQASIAALELLTENEGETAAGFAANLEAAKAVEMGECWEEFAGAAASMKDEVILFLETAHAVAVKREDEAAELERLRKEEAGRKEREEKERLEKEQREREEKAAEEARLLAEKKAKEAREVAAREAKEREERLRIEKEVAEENAKRQERERIAAEERAKVEREQAAAQAKKDEAAAIDRTKREEAERNQREKDEADAKQAKIESNKRHVGKIRKEAKEGLMTIGFDLDDAVKIVKAIAAGQIPNVSINY